MTRSQWTLYSWLVVLGVMLVIVDKCSSTELTFELPDREEQCFYEEIEKDVNIIFEFQVIQGGNYDVDVKLISPGNGVLYQEQRKQYDSHEFKTQVSGEYYFCFSNEFSSFSHKTIYFDFIVGEEAPLSPEIGAHHTALTQLETSAISIHESLKLISDYQTHHRLREVIGRNQAEKMNERVLYWSLAEAIALVVVAVGQVMILRRFFAEKRTSI